jgi:mannose-6-phosphate isomerase-like protein (cupin superfamily)
MSIVNHHAVPLQSFPGGATYQTLVGDDEGSTPVRVGIQTSPPGYATPTHSHPYMEILTILSGTGEAWIEGQEGLTMLEPGMTLVLSAHQPHWFRATGNAPLVTYGVHASPDRIVDIHEG